MGLTEKELDELERLVKSGDMKELKRLAEERAAAQKPDPRGGAPAIQEMLDARGWKVTRLISELNANGVKATDHMYVKMRQDDFSLRDLFAISSICGYEMTVTLRDPVAGDEITIE